MGEIIAKYMRGKNSGQKGRNHVRYGHFFLGWSLIVIYSEQNKYMLIRSNHSMCGIVGYVGRSQAVPILIDELSKLEYRGYDSAGLAVRDGETPTKIIKTEGRLEKLCKEINSHQLIHGICGIGHTRWATHGKPNQINAHPHISDGLINPISYDTNANIIGVHNGIIENYIELKEKLSKHGYVFYSHTDSEVVIKLIDYYYKKHKAGPIDALAKTMVRIRGSYALEVMFKDSPGEIWIAKKDSPLSIGIKDGESYVSFDIPAILKYTHSVYYLDDFEMAKITAGAVQFYNLDGDAVQKNIVKIQWNAKSAAKSGYEHFMMKEIYEQPKAVSDTLNSLLKDRRIDLSDTGLSDTKIKDISSITIVACGSAWHVGMVGQYIFEDFAKIPVRVEISSEFRYRNPILDKTQLVIVISQSGETADSLAALRLAKSRGIQTLAIVNVVGSSIAREADMVLYSLAGPEISVATTKAYSAQLVVVYCLALQFGIVRQKIQEDFYFNMINELKSIPGKIVEVLKNQKTLQNFAVKYANSKDIFLLEEGLIMPFLLKAV